MGSRIFNKLGKALIVNPPAVIDGNFIDYPYFSNLGALQLASVAAAGGFDVSVSDSFAFPDSSAAALPCGRLSIGCSMEALIDNAGESSFDAVVACVSVFHRPFVLDDNLAAFFKALRRKFPDAPIAAADAYFGGMHYVEYAGDDFMRNYPEVDVLIKHEAETAVLKWLKNINPNILQERRIIDEAPPASLDKMPFPAWDMIDVKEYQRFLRCFLKAAGRRTDFTDIMPALPVVTSRGCLYSCAFCSGTDVLKRGKHRRISSARLRGHLEALKQKFAIKGIVVLDGLANADPAGFSEMLETIRAVGLKVSFVNGLRADRLEKSHIELLAEITPSLAVSAESASERIRNGILNKRLDISCIEKVAGWCAEYKLPLGIHYMVGVPGETALEVNETFDHAQAMSALNGAEPLMQFCAPLPGSALYGKLVAEGRKVPDMKTNYFKIFNEGRECPDDESGSLKISRMLHSFKMRMRESSPEKLIINLTYRCNNKCVMCAVGGRPKSDMSFETCAELLSEYSGRRVTMLDIDGGEPTLHPGLFRIIEKARVLGYRSINVTTNGRRLASRDFASRLLLSGISDLHISVYGTGAKIHDSVTGANGSFDETVNGIRNVVRLKPERIVFTANTVLTVNNYARISELMEWLAGLGVQALDVQFPTPFGAAAQNCLPPFEKAIEEYVKASEKFRNDLKLNLINLPPCRMPSGLPEARADAEKYGRHMAFVNSPVQSLGAFLATRRRREPECLGCEYWIICEGFYFFE